MSRFKDIFHNEPETMSNRVKWFFGLPLAYVVYLIISLIIPGNWQIMRFAVLILCVLALVRYFLHFDFKFLCESGKWNNASFCKGIYLMFVALCVTNLCIALVFPDSIVRSTDTAGLFSNWIVSLVLVVVAAFCEELIFRCYIAWFGKTESDDLCRSTKGILIYALISAVLFTVAHFSNPEVESSAVWSMIFYFVFGFGLMLCFMKTKGIEYGLGIHIANNLFSAWVVNYNSSVLTTKSLFINQMPIGFITVFQAVICILFCVIMCPGDQAE